MFFTTLLSTYTLTRRLVPQWAMNVSWRVFKGRMNYYLDCIYLYGFHVVV